MRAMGGRRMANAVLDRLSAHDHVLARLFSPVDIAPLVWFRVIFGAIFVWEVYRYFSHGWIARYYIDPVFYFSYYGFDWVRPWPGNFMYLHFGVLGILAFAIMVGLWYRAAAVLFCVGFWYVFLLDQTRYLNHFYLLGLISFLLIFIPANRSLSLDAWRRPMIRLDTVPAWTLWLLRAQIGVVYVFGGVAKLNADWLRGEPMRTWLARRTDFPVIGSYFSEEWMVYAFSYGGLFVDLLIVPLLLWRRTLIPALVLSVLFHVLNAQLFRIGVFPWFMIGASVLFLPAAWLRLGGLWKPADAGVAEPSSEQSIPTRSPPHLLPVHYATIALLATYMTVQLVVPLRHHLYPGDVAWTEQGHRFSWRMMLRTKSGQAMFHVSEPTSAVTWEIDPRDYLLRHQSVRVVTHPDMILQFSHQLARHFQDAGYDDVEVHAVVATSLNGRQTQSYIDSSVDLTKERRTLTPTPWILPLVEVARDTAESQ